MKLMVTLLLLSTAFSALADPLKPNNIVPFKETPQGELRLHFFNPAGLNKNNKRPAIIFYFGGGWHSGSPSQFYPQAKHLADRGMVAICAEYRIKKTHSTDPRACVMDAKSAMRWVRQRAKNLGIDPNRIAAGGGSAGGHLAAATATLSWFDEPGEDSSVSCVPNALVLFNPVYDNSENGYGHDRVSKYWKEFSPLHKLKPGMPPTIVFLGTNDNLIPVETAEKFQKIMKDNGDRSELVLYKDMPHGFFNPDKENNRYKETLAETDAFLVSLKWLKPQKK
ncbi:alpha/beta hydrolase [Pontiella agarivorans]|uniref:Alpha/beta hydrolase n=1 Tax=Pontiella agarivorans TaxID=3038953 RepID=A0ABU5N0K8_9BACT|nr:alpha/beta hydrolase [Pontiella agarivorans]MDZ8119990.1 alpha/beta hydrolase [Pontiella agarivorans]